jgi:hypothetical protein
MPANPIQSQSLDANASLGATAINPDNEFYDEGCVGIVQVNFELSVLIAKLRLDAKVAHSELAANLTDSNQFNRLVVYLARHWKTWSKEQLTLLLEQAVLNELVFGYRSDTVNADLYCQISRQPYKSLVVDKADVLSSSSKALLSTASSRTAFSPSLTTKFAMSPVSPNSPPSLKARYVASSLERDWLGCGQTENVEFIAPDLRKRKLTDIFEIALKYCKKQILDLTDVTRNQPALSRSVLDNVSLSFAIIHLVSASVEGKWQSVCGLAGDQTLREDKTGKFSRAQREPIDSIPHLDLLRGYAVLLNTTAIVNTLQWHLLNIIGECGPTDALGQASMLLRHVEYVVACVDILNIIGCDRHQFLGQMLLQIIDETMFTKIVGFLMSSAASTTLAKEAAAGSASVEEASLLHRRLYYVAQATAYLYRTLVHCYVPASDNSSTAYSNEVKELILCAVRVLSTLSLISSRVDIAVKHSTSESLELLHNLQLKVVLASIELALNALCQKTGLPLKATMIVRKQSASGTTVSLNQDEIRNGEKFTVALHRSLELSCEKELVTAEVLVMQEELTPTHDAVTIEVRQINSSTTTSRELTSEWSTIVVPELDKIISILSERSASNKYYSAGRVRSDLRSDGTNLMQEKARTEVIQKIMDLSMFQTVVELHLESSFHQSRYTLRVVFCRII